jgi:hypothetical protein
MHTVDISFMTAARVHRPQETNPFAGFFYASRLAAKLASLDHAAQAVSQPGDPSSPFLQGACTSL